MLYGAIKLHVNRSMEVIMFILFVNGIPSIKLGKKSEIPARQGEESWQVIDAQGRTIASYWPGR
jgi:hypothetical protein